MPSLRLNTVSHLGLRHSQVARPQHRWQCSTSFSQLDGGVLRLAKGSASRRRASHACQATRQTFSSFDDMLQASELPVLVEFYATWCGPCVMMGTTLAEASQLYKGKLKVVKIDTDKYPTIASKFNVQGLPTVVLFDKQRVVARLEGYATTPQLQSWLQQHRIQA